MMPAGCDFICKNDDCTNYGTSFTITAPWPMGEIDLVIDSLEDPDLKNDLIKIKNQGRKHACLTLPNDNDIEIKKYRIQLWSPKAKCIWNYEVDNLNENYKKELPSKCPKTNCKLLYFEDVIKNGILCPLCNEPLHQERWYSQDK